jgi:hypothetical protein
MDTFSPEIKEKLLDRARKNAKWVKRLDTALNTIDPSDPKREKVEKMQQILKIQAMLIVKKLKELDPEPEGTPESNGKPDLTPMRRDPTTSTRGFNAGSGQTTGTV